MLTLQEKLALMMTSAGSQRNLAAMLGITHQKVGRWLREGEQGGIKSIPDDSATVDAINLIFSIHSEVVRSQAKVDNVPFDKNVPVYTERKPLRTGLTGDRVISGNTEFIRQPLRVRWIADVVKSQRYYKVNVRSRINLKRYFQDRAAEELESGRRGGISRNRLASAMLNSFVEREESEKHRIVDKVEPFPLFTQSENTMPGTEPWRVARGVEDQLAQKHSPATGEPGTRFAYEYLLQLIPANYVKQPARKSSGSRKAAKPKGGRGPK